MQLGGERRGDGAERPLGEVDDPVGSVDQDEADPEQGAEHPDDQPPQVHPVRDGERVGHRREDPLPARDDDHEPTGERGQSSKRATIPQKTSPVPSAVCSPKALSRHPDGTRRSGQSPSFQVPVALD
jgi:hypothetical protein